MLILVILALFLAAIAAAVFLLTVKISLDYTLKNKDDRMQVIFSILRGLITYRYSLSDQWEERKRKPAPEQSLLDAITDKLDNLKEVFGLIVKIRCYLRKNILLRQFMLDVAVGTGDAFYTGLLTGVVWAAAGSLTSYIATSFKTLGKCVNVVPDFDEKKFEVELHCIFNIKLVHIIVVGFKIIINRKKKKLQGGDVSVGASD
jgi:hypothetical protein